MERKNKASSVVNFIIIGVIIAAVVIGGIYLVRQQTAQPEPVTPQETAHKPQPQQPTKSEESPIKPQPAPTEPTATELPQGGPAELVGSLAVVALLGGVGASYMRSRRPELSL